MTGKSGRAVEGVGLENQSGESHRGFESLRFLHGGLAHLVEHLLCTQKVIGSTPISSTNGDVAQW